MNFDDDVPPEAADTKQFFGSDEKASPEVRAKVDEQERCKFYGPREGSSAEARAKVEEAERRKTAWTDSSPRSLPFSEDAEKALLCSMILSQDVLYECASTVSPQLFYDPANQILFSTLCELSRDYGPADFISVKTLLANRQQLQEIGGAEYLNELWSFVPNSAQYGHYVSILTDHFRRRTTILECQRLIEKIYDLDASAYEAITEGVETALTKLALQVAKPDKSFRTLVKETVDAIERRSLEKTISGIQFDLPSLDTELGGVQPGEFCVISGQTSRGKTALALQAVLSTGKAGFTVGLFSFEMPGTQIVERLLAAEGNLSMKILRTGKFPEAELAKLHASVERISDYALFIEDQSSYDVNQIVSRCRYLKVKYKASLIVVDYLQLVPSGSSRRDTSREREVADISRRLKLMALELDVAVVALSQLNDQGRLRESRAIGQDADIVLKIDESKSENAFAVDIVIDKHRSGARNKRLTFEFFGEYMQFQDVEKRSE